MTEYRLPLPPSSNNAYINLPKGGRALSKQGRAWKEAALWELKAQRAKPFEGRAIVNIDLSEQDAAKSSDAANREKLVTDVLVQAGVLKDDSMPHVQRISIGWVPDLTGCRVRLEAA